MKFRTALWYYFSFGIALLYTLNDYHLKQWNPFLWPEKVLIDAGGDVITVLIGALVFAFFNGSNLSSGKSSLP